MYKAFITDIDGTLTDNRRRLSTAAVEEIRRLIDADIPVVLIIILYYIRLSTDVSIEP